MKPCCLLFLFACVLPPVFLRGAPPPNIVLIVADDLGYGEVRHLNPERCLIATPYLDRLFREGMTFTDAHSASSVCTPTRYGILTGRYAWRTHLQKAVLNTLSPPLITTTRPTLASLLRGAGYETAIVGKWHLGMTWPRKARPGAENGQTIDYAGRIADGPLARGFGYFFGISASLDMGPYVYLENDRFLGAATVEQKEWSRHALADPKFHAADVLPVLTRKAVDYIGSRNNLHARTPFFLYFALTSPHTPIMPSREWRGRSGLGDYGDFVMQTDAAVGEVLAALERAGLASETAVIFTSDNGCSARPARAAALQERGHFPSGPYRGYKADLWEGGHRVPFAVRWPKKVESGSRSERLICLNDIVATCAELAGVTLPVDAAEDSVSFLPALLGRTQAPRPAIVHHSIAGHFAIRDGAWKLLLARGSGGWTSPTEKEATVQKLPPVQLYNLDDDPGEQSNVADKHPDVVARLTDLLSAIVADGRSTPGPRLQNDVAVDMWKHGNGIKDL